MGTKRGLASAAISNERPSYSSSWGDIGIMAFSPKVVV
jgi:hypothetical protein